MRQTLVGTYARATRDWYRGPIADIGMHADLVGYLMTVAAPLASPIAPHPTSIQRALLPTQTQPADLPKIAAGGYMRTLVKTVRDAGLTPFKMLGKA